MAKKVSLYLLGALIMLVVFVLGVLAATLFLKKPGPAVTAVQPSAQVLGLEKAVTPSVIGREAAVKPEIPPMPAVPRITFKPEFQKGMTLVAWTEGGYSNTNSVKAMEQLVSLGVDWVCLVPTWYQQGFNSTQIFSLKEKTTSDESLTFAIKKLHELKIKVMLKPHLDLVKSEGKWRGDIGFSDPNDWQAWFDSYTNFILHFAKLAAQENVEILCIGTELTNATTTQPEFWTSLSKKVREVYSGQLTYAANWNDEFNQIKFWEALDYAGVDSYFPLVTGARPSVEQLKEVWLDWLKLIGAWQKSINKPILLTEIGYKSTLDAIDEPWQYTGMGELDLQMQVKCYQALLEIFWDKPWFYGAYWWYWGVHPNMGGEDDRGFTPQNKPAQEVIKEWYSKPVTEKVY